MLRIEYEPSEQRAAAYEDNKRVGICTYEISDGEWAIMHTIVDPAFGGRGIARKLVDRVLEEAEKASVKVVPVCSYAVKVMNEKA